MIKNITSGHTSGYLHVDGGHQSMAYIQANSNIPLLGVIRYIGTSYEVFDGSTWKPLGGSIPSVHLSQSAINALDWATKKAEKETRLKELAKNNVTIADALRNLEEAEAKLNVVLTLTGA